MVITYNFASRTWEKNFKLPYYYYYFNDLLQIVESM